MSAATTTTTQVWQFVFTSAAVIYSGISGAAEPSASSSQFHFFSRAFGSEMLENAASRREKPDPHPGHNYGRKHLYSKQSAILTKYRIETWDQLEDWLRLDWEVKGVW